MIEIDSFRTIIRLFGLPSELADEIGAKANTVSKWAQRDFIPSEWWRDVEGAALGRGFTGVTVDKMADLAAARREVA